MSLKYELHDPLSGEFKTAPNFEEAKSLRLQLRNNYINEVVNKMIAITVLIENEDGSWTQALADDEGNPVPPTLPDDLE
jgi:hypothetical protein